MIVAVITGFFVGLALNCACRDDPVRAAVCGAISGCGLWVLLG